MDGETSRAPDQRRQDFSGSAMSGLGITIDGVTADETIIIRTSNSSYRFMVENPSSRRGYLTGGVAGEIPVSALFLEARTTGPSGSERDSTRPAIGARALFLLESDEGMKHLMTSPIKTLTLERDG